MSRLFVGPFSAPRLRIPALVGAAVVFAAVAWKAPNIESLSLALLVTATSMVVGIRRQWVRASVLDPFAPYCFPLAFVAVSTLWPAWLVLHDKVALMGFSPARYGPHTAGLIATSVIGVAIGVHLPGTYDGGPPTDQGPPRDETVRVAALVRLAGRILAGVLVLAALANAVLVGPQSRALNQSTYQVSDSEKSALLILALPAVLLILVARPYLPALRKSTLLDWSLIGALVVGSALGGGRALSIIVMLCIAYCLTRRKRTIGRTLAPFVAIAIFALAVLAYRQWAVRAQVTHDPFLAVATDLSPISYTLGLVSAQVPSTVPYQLGLTYGDALTHMMPSIITGPILGASGDSGSMIFRDQILHVTNPNSGFGFSVPAEAYLNFGLIGVLVVALVLGWLLAWAYSRQSWPSLRARSLVYVCLVAPFPFAYRSDTIGAVKGSLYPLLLVAMSLLVARRIANRPLPSWLQGVAGSRSHTYLGVHGPSSQDRHLGEHEQYQRDDRR